MPILREPLVEAIDGRKDDRRDQDAEVDRPRFAMREAYQWRSK